MTEHEHAHAHPEHKHIRFEGASLVAARLCPGCGCYVETRHLTQHQEFHDEFELLKIELAALNGKTAPEEVGETQLELG